jgi:hypothetical protein
MAKAEDYVNIPDGKWTDIQAQGFRHSCCDCGLVHAMDVRQLASGQVQLRATRKKRATAQRRRRLGVKVDKHGSH